MTMSDRIAVMNHGRIEQVGTPSTVYDAPESAYVAGFIGQQNFFSGTVDRADGGAVGIAVEAGLCRYHRPGGDQPSPLLAEGMRQIAQTRLKEARRQNSAIEGNPELVRLREQIRLKEKELRSLKAKLAGAELPTYAEIEVLNLARKAVVHYGFSLNAPPFLENSY